MKLPVHRWFRYSAGFSAEWAERVVRGQRAKRGELAVLDPFAGSATTMIASQVAGVTSIGLEAHPLVARIAAAKLAWDTSPEQLQIRAAEILSAAKPREWPAAPALLAKIYEPDALAQLLGLREALASEQRGDRTDLLLWLARVSILRSCSPVGTAPWQYVLPNKSKSRVADPKLAFGAQVEMMVEDMRAMPRASAAASLRAEDARLAASVADHSIDLVLTSPPYPNNYDYADATRIEMTFLGEIERWADLHAAVRTHLIRSCSQHMVGYDPAEALASAELAPIRAELGEVFERLGAERESHRGRKAYNLMAVAYFHDLALTWKALRRVCRPGAEALWVVGDSAPYGVHMPVERWLGELALGAGFSDWSFEKIRDRNLKWKNRKHRVPLQEGLLRVRG